MTKNSRLQQQDKRAPNACRLAPSEIVSVMAQREVAPRHFRLTLQSPRVARLAHAGQFVHLLPRQGLEFDPLLRRAFSVVSVEEDRFDILYRVMGRGTAAMSRWTIGDTVDVLGPLGQGFSLTSEYSILVGGGVGVPPLALLAAQRPSEATCMALLGARHVSEVLCLDDFARWGVEVEIATDDGSGGHHGFVTDLLLRQLQKVGTSAEQTGVRVPPTVFACGPLPMLRTVATLCAQYDVLCQVSLEEAMPCGVGVCNGCVIPVVSSGDEYSSYRRICVEGPVLQADDVDWENFSNLSPC